jgi:hypothetical protein
MSDEAVQPAEQSQDAPSGDQEVKTPETPVAEEAPSTEDVSFHTVEKEGVVTAIWEMQGQKHLRTIDPRSVEGKQILALFETAG